MIKVIGDVILDRWISGTVERISQEAPVPILLEHNEKYSLGGAANVAANLSNLGADVELYGVASYDAEGYELRNLLDNHKIKNKLQSHPNQTTVKTRLVGPNGQHLLRWDKEKNYTSNECVDSLINTLSEDDIVVVSDYNKGIIQEDTVKRILKKTNKIFVDPLQNPEYYSGAYLVKPNMKEYKNWNGTFHPESAVSFMKNYGWTWLVVTDGGNGIHVLNHDGGYVKYSEPVREVADVSGAGDVVISVIVNQQYKNNSIPESCKLACKYAAKSVEKRGICIVDLYE